MGIRREVAPPRASYNEEKNQVRAPPPATTTRRSEAMSGTFELKKASNGEYMFNLLAGNGQIVLTSEQYKARDSALNGIESVRKNAADPKRFERRTAKDGRPYFVLKAGNGQEIGRSQFYAGADGMENGIRSVSENAAGAALKDLTA